MIFQHGLVSLSVHTVHPCLHRCMLRLLYKTKAIHLYEPANIPVPELIWDNTYSNKPTYQMLLDTKDVMCSLQKRIRVIQTGISSKLKSQHLMIVTHSDCYTSQYHSGKQALKVSHVLAFVLHPGHCRLKKIAFPAFYLCLLFTRLFGLCCHCQNLEVWFILSTFSWKTT